MLGFLVFLFPLYALACVSRHPKLTSRIAGGETADNVPWVAALSYGDIVQWFQCAGSIVTDRHILTAAHCIEAAYTNGSLFSSYMATVGTNVRDGSGLNYTIISNYTHPNYTMNMVKNDLGLLITNASLEFSVWVKQITINFNRVSEGTRVLIYGWGSIGFTGPLSMNLEKLEMETVNASYCFEETRRVGKILGFVPPFIDPQKELCAFKAKGSGTCKGDSGSPLVCAKNKEQIGLTSWGIPCALGAPDMFTRLSNYKDWILSTIDKVDHKHALKHTMNDCSNDGDN